MAEIELASRQRRRGARSLSIGRFFVFCGGTSSSRQSSALHLVVVLHSSGRAVVPIGTTAAYGHSSNVTT